MSTKLLSVDIVFLFQLAGMKVGDDFAPEVFRKACDAYRFAYTRIATDYCSLASAFNDDGTHAYRIKALAGLTEPRDEAKVFGVWFTSDTGFSRAIRIDLLTLCSMRMYDAARDAGIAYSFEGGREMRTYETLECVELY